MGIPKHKQTLSIEEYLAGEQDVEVRHEYVSGQIYAMAGTSDRHNRIAINLVTKLDPHIEGNPCELFISEMKVKVADDLVYYPDVMVACDKPPRDPYCRTHPVLVVEVLSPSTQRIDQGEKLNAYRNVPSIRDYLIVAQDQMRVDLHQRQDAGDWKHLIFTEPDEVVAFVSVSLSLQVSDIYRGVRFEA